MLKLKAAIHGILDRSPARPSAEAETQLILFHFFRDRARELAGVDVPPEIEAEALAIARERARGIPLQHLLGYQFFYEHEYRVTPATLIPRPETEILVQAAISWARTHALHRMAELGLGSGAITGEILSACPDATAITSELSADAAAVAEANLRAVLGGTWPSRVHILRPEHGGVGFEIFVRHGPFDLVVSNPPYVSLDDEIEQQVLLHEPHAALFPSPDAQSGNPDYFYENFAFHAQALLKPRGAAFFEVPHERAARLAEMFAGAGLQIETIPDLTGRPRVLKCNF